MFYRNFLSLNKNKIVNKQMVIYVYLCYEALSCTSVLKILV